MHVCGRLNWQQYTKCYGMYQWFKMAKFMTYDPLYSIDFLQAKMPSDRYDNCTVYTPSIPQRQRRMTTMCISESNDFICVVLAMIIFIWTCQMEFSSFSSFSHTPRTLSRHSSMSNATFLTFFFGFGSRHRFSFLALVFLSLSPSFSHSWCLLTAFRYRQEANIEKIEWKMGQLGEECIQHALWVCRCSSS